MRLLTSRLDDLVAEDRDVLRAGLATAPLVTVDDTAARHARQDGVTTQIGDGRFTAFRTGVSKSRQAFLSVLRAGHGEYVISAAALGYMRGFRLGEHALCWVHAERLVHKLVPANDQQRRAVELTRHLIWWFYADLSYRT